MFSLIVKRKENEGGREVLFFPSLSLPAIEILRSTHKVCFFPFGGE